MAQSKVVMTMLSVSNFDQSVRSQRTTLIGLLVVGLTAVFPTAGLGKETLADVIENVVANEKLYDNISLTIRSSYRDLVTEKGAPFSVIESMTTSEREIVQGEKLLHTVDSKVRNAGASHDEIVTRVTLFDGKTARILRQDVLHVTDESPDRSEVARPHSALLPDYLMVPFSELLRGDTVTRNHARLASVRLAVSILGQEEILGRQCAKVEVINFREGQRPEDLGFIRLFWLDAARNYIPVRLRGFAAKSDPSRPTEEGDVVSMIELEPGIWFPERVQYNTYVDLARDGQRALKTVTEKEFAQVRLDPKEPLSTFQDLENKKLTVTYYVQSGNITKRVLNESTRRSNHMYLIIAGNLAVLLATLGIWRFHCWRAKRSSSPSGESLS
jgi:hypothetical protein